MLRGIGDCVRHRIANQNTQCCGDPGRPKGSPQCTEIQRVLCQIHEVGKVDFDGDEPIFHFPDEIMERR